MSFKGLEELWFNTFVTKTAVTPPTPVVENSSKRRANWYYTLKSLYSIDVSDNIEEVEMEEICVPPESAEFGEEPSQGNALLEAAPTEIDHELISVSSESPDRMPSRYTGVLYATRLKQYLAYSVSNATVYYSKHDGVLSRLYGICAPMVKLSEFYITECLDLTHSAKNAVVFTDNDTIRERLYNDRTYVLVYTSNSIEWTIGEINLHSISSKTAQRFERHLRSVIGLKAQVEVVKGLRIRPEYGMNLDSPPP